MDGVKQHRLQWHRIISASIVDPVIFTNNAEDLLMARGHGYRELSFVAALIVCQRIDQARFQGVPVNIANNI